MAATIWCLAIDTALFNHSNSFWKSSSSTCIIKGKEMSKETHHFESFKQITLLVAYVHHWS